MFTETDMYTIHLPDGSRDLRFEHGLSGLESDIATLRRTKLASRESLTDEDRLILVAFTAAMRSRTPRVRDHWAAQFTAVRERMDAMREVMRAKSPAERARTFIPPTGDAATRLSRSDVDALARNPIHMLLESAFEVQLPLLAQMQLTVVCTDDEPGFITSDHPCCWFDAQAHTRPPTLRGVGLGFPTVEVTLPVSPRQALFVSWVPTERYMTANAEMVDEINRRTRIGAAEHFVVSRNEVRPSWFNPGEPGREDE